jgi:hypothetical protein
LADVPIDVARLGVWIEGLSRLWAEHRVPCVSRLLTRAHPHTALPGGWGWARHNLRFRSHVCLVRIRFITPEGFPPSWEVAIHLEPVCPPSLQLGRDGCVPRCEKLSPTKPRQAATWSSSSFSRLGRWRRHSGLARYTSTREPCPSMLQCC